MAIQVHCPQCGRKLQAPDTAVGRQAKCPSCSSLFTVPAMASSGIPEDDILDAEPIPTVMSEGRSTPAHGFDAPREIPRAKGVDGAEGGEGDRRPCPMCGEMIPAGALKCRFCNEIFDPKMKRQAGATASDEKLTTGEWCVAILCSGIGCICGIMWMIQGKPKGKTMFFVSLLCGMIWGVIRVMIEGAK